MNTVVEKKKAPVAVAWTCLVLAWAFMVLPIPLVSSVFGWGLNLAAFILSIVVISRGAKGSGIVMIASTLVVSPVVYFIGLTFFAAIIDSGKSRSSAESDKISESAVEATDQAQQREEASISSEELYAAYEQNEIAADQLYKGKWLRVTGRVESIDSDLSDQPVIMLLGDGYFSNVHADGLPINIAMTLSKGQTITVICRGAGEVVGSPMLEDCELQ